jgi:hypothetical protein
MKLERVCHVFFRIFRFIETKQNANKKINVNQYITIFVDPMVVSPRTAPRTSPRFGLFFCRKFFLGLLHKTYLACLIPPPPLFFF